jgi:hypothetical protein
MGLEEQLLTASINDTFSDAWKALRKVDYEMRGNTQDNTEEGEHADDLREAEDTLAFYVDKAFRDVAILAERLGLPLLRQDIAQSRASFGKLGEVYQDDNFDFDSKALRAARNFFVSLEAMTAGRSITGLGVFETVLENTAKIIEARGLAPSSEKEVRDAVMEVLGFTFRDVVREIPIAQNLKIYKPDIGVRSLMAAAEYKFIDSKEDAKKALDDVYTDMKGYSGRYDWRSFYAVFYMTGPFYSQKDLDLEFRFVKAELSWTPIVVVGSGQRKLPRAKKDSKALPAPLPSTPPENGKQRKPLKQR